MTDDPDTPILAGSPAPAGRQQVASCAVDATVLIKAMAHQGRMSILCHLIEGEKTVGELEALLGQRQAAVSQHLARLRNEGLVRARRDGKTRLYRFADPRAAKVVALVHELYCLR